MKKDTNKKTDDGKEYAITTAKIQDDFCNYSFNILRGTGTGDSHNVKGKGIVLDDLKTAFAKFNVHLAALDDTFKHAEVKIGNIDKMRTHELAQLYQCNGFKIKGTDENVQLVLMGTKFVSVGGHIALETPQVLVDKFSAYPHWKELKEAMDGAVLEVEDYKEGKCVPVEPEDFIDAGQSTLADDPNFEQGRVTE